jgi:hypothetical protein
MAYKGRMSDYGVGSSLYPPALDKEIWKCPRCKYIEVK